MTVKHSSAASVCVAITLCDERTETDSDEPLSSLRFVGDAVFLAGCSNGNVYVADTRTPAPPRLHPPPTSPGDPALWQTEASPSGAVVRLSACGRAVVSDTRSPGGAAGRARLEVPPGGRGPEGGVSWAPALDGCIAVSGEFNQLVSLA